MSGTDKHAPFENNVFDCALVLEGGGMRCAYTAGILTALVENKVFFDYVCGISAGSSSALNYLSRDTKRIKYAFVDVASDPAIGGAASMARGKGFFAYAQAQHADPSRQQFWLVPGAGHDDRAMFESKCGVAALFDAGACTTRLP